MQRPAGVRAACGGLAGSSAPLLTLREPTTRLAPIVQAVGGAAG